MCTCLHGGNRYCPPHRITFDWNGLAPEDALIVYMEFLVHLVISGAANLPENKGKEERETAGGGVLVHKMGLGWGQAEGGALLSSIVFCVRFEGH
jgi:hypothetical protein